MSVTQPKLTLRDEAALVVVDVQRGFHDGVYWGPRNNPECEENIVALLDHWRSTGRPVVFVRHDSSDPRTPEGDLVSAETLAQITATNLHGEFATVTTTQEIVNA